MMCDKKNKCIVVNKGSERRGKGKLGGGRVLFCTVTLALFFLILKNSELAIEHMERGMKLCVSAVIPALFPFMVVSELVVGSGLAEKLGKPLEKISRCLFGIGGEGASAFLLGTVCGFPVGTRSALSLYKRKRITHGELSRLICFSNNPSSAFVVSAIGATLFGSRLFGTVLYFTTLISSISVGILHKLCYGNESSVATVKSDGKEAVQIDPASAFSSAVTSAAYAMLGVCAFIIFFSVLTGLIGNILLGIGASQGIKAWVFSIFELTGGVAAAAQVKPTELGALIAAFAVGWSGISVHFQMASFCGEVRVPFGRYLLSKIVQGVVNAVLTYAYICFFGDGISFSINAESVAAFGNSADTGNIFDLISASFFSVLFMNLFSRVKRWGGV